MKRVILGLLLLPSLYLFSQAPVNSSNITFEEARLRYWERVKHHIDLKEGDELHEYYRWENFWSRRSDSPDKIQKALYSLYKHPLCVGSASKGNWRLLGPVRDLRNCGSMGIVISLAADPQNKDIVYAGSRHGGLWRGNFSQDSVYWENLTDILRLPGLGIQWIAVDPTNSDIIYAATGLYGYSNGGFFSYGFGVGLLRSTDGGQSWSVLGYSTMKSDTEQVVKKVLINPENPQTIYILTSRHVYRSYDRGDTWQAVFSRPDSINGIWPFTEFVDMEMLPGDTGAVYVSTNVGGGGYPIFGHFFPGLPCTNDSIAFDEGKVYFTLDGGNNWEELPLDNGEGSASDYVVLAVTPATPHLIYVAYNTYLMSYGIQCGTGNNSSNIIYIPPQKTVIEAYQKNKARVKRTLKTTGALLNVNRFSPHSFQISPTDTSVMYCESGDRVVVKSTDGGKSFFDVSSYNGDIHADQRVILLLSGSPPNSAGANDSVLVGNDGGVALSPTGGNNWQIKNGIGLAITEFNCVSHALHSPDIFAGGTQDNETFIYEQGSWYASPLASDAAHVVFDCEYDSICYAQGYGGGSIFPLYKYYKTSSSWIKWGGKYGKKYLPEPSHYLVSMQGVNNTLYVGLKRIWKIPFSNLRPFGSSLNFQVISPYFCKNTDNKCKNSLTIKKISVCEADTNVIWISTSRKTWALDSIVYKTTDGGITWTDVTPNIKLVPEVGDLGFTEASAILVNPEDPNEIWIGLGNIRANTNQPPPYNGKLRVLHSMDGGNTWEDYSDNLPAFPVNDIVYEKGTGAGDLYVATDAGIFYTNKKLYKTHGWVCFSSGLPICLVTDLDIDYHSGKIRAATYGRGIWESPLACPSQFDIYHTGQIPADLYEASYGIYSNGTILPGKTIYRAGYEIVLSDGFVADGSQGVDFHAYIRPCGDFPPDILKDSYVSVQKVSYEKQKNKGTSSLKIYPNPTSDKFTIEIPEEGCYEIQVQNLVGQTILQEKTCESKTEISMQRFPSGIYFVKVSGEKSYFGKIVKQ